MCSFCKKKKKGAKDMPCASPPSSVPVYLLFVYWCNQMVHACHGGHWEVHQDPQLVAPAPETVVSWQPRPVVPPRTALLGQPMTN